MRILLIWLLAAAALFLGCSPSPAAESQPPATTPSSQSVHETAASATPLPTATPLPSATAVPPNATIAPTPTNPIALITATPSSRQTEPFVSYGIVEQPPYAASECSDKYPCNDDAAAWEARIQVPPGFEARYFAYLEGEQPTAMTFGPGGRLYVATQGGSIVTVDRSGNISPFFEGLLAPTGLTFRPGTEQLYLSSRVVEDNANGEAQVSMIDQEGRIHPIITGLPCCYAFMHGPHAIVFDSAGWGYVGVGAKSDHGEVLGQSDVQAALTPFEASIVRFSPDGRTVEQFASGLRNPYGIAIDANDQLYAADNGPDFGPPDEFHRIVPGANHGYPWYDCAGCFEKPAAVEPLPPEQLFPPHSAPTGMAAYLGEQFPAAYNNIFATLWSAFPEAQRVMRLGPNGREIETFATGFAAPIALAVSPDGSLYVADWATGIIFEISYTG